MQYNLINEGRKNRIAESDYNSASLDIQFKINNPNVKRSIDLSDATNFLMKSGIDESGMYYVERYSKSQKSLPEIKSDFEKEHGASQLHIFATKVVLRAASILYLMEHHKIGYSYLHPANMFGESADDLRVAIRRQVEEKVAIRSDTAINMIRKIFLWGLSSDQVLNDTEHDYSDLELPQWVHMSDDNANRSINTNEAATLDTYYEDFLQDPERKIKQSEDIFKLFDAMDLLDEVKVYAGSEDESITPIEEPIEETQPEPKRRSNKKHQHPEKKKHQPKKPVQKKSPKGSTGMGKKIAMGAVILALLGGGGYAYMNSHNNTSDNQTQASSSTSNPKVDVDKITTLSAQGKYSQAADLASEVTSLDDYTKDETQTIMTSLLADYRYDKVLDLSSDKDDAAAQIYLSLKTDNQKSAYKNMQTSDEIIDAFKSGIDGNTDRFGSIASDTTLSDHVKQAIAQTFANSDHDDQAKDFVSKHQDAKSAFQSAYLAKDKSDMAGNFK